MAGISGPFRPAIRIAYRIAQRVRLFYWHVFKPRTYGVKIIAVNGDGKVLLVRHSYHRSNDWLLPGGGIKRGEAPEDAARRELKEETGLDATDFALFGVYENRGEGARNKVSLFTATAMGEAVIDRVEIVEAAFFAADAPPIGVGPATLRRMQEWLGKQPISPDW